MAIASLDNIEKTFGKRVLFDKLSLTIYEGERIGFIGANGSGKTTLFKVLVGQVVPDTGTVAISKGTRIGYLTQDPVFDPENTVIDEAELAFAELHRLAHRLRELEHEMAGKEGEELQKILRQYQHTQHEFDLAGGYAWRHKLEATLLGVGLERITWEQNVQTLSGGQGSRLALARLLISEPDLLLLDEPTNHLDLNAIEWLERYLLSFKGAVILVSHDRFLLDRLATRIVWLHDLHIDSFPGNYSAFVQQRELIELTQERQYEQQQAYIEKQQEFIRRFGAGQRSKEARGRQTRLQRMMRSDEMIRKVSADHHIRLSLNTDRRAGDQVLVLRDLCKAYGENKLWQSFSLLVNRGERIGIIGPNGSGKTTLLQVLLGENDADAGEVKWGANLNIGYYDQRLDDFDPENSIMEEVRQGRDAKEKEVRDILALMLYRGDDVHKPIGLLSGGERARVRLAELLLDRPNVLLLDEPTNHLDIASREALEAALGQFGGTILCVSHDRYFLDKVVKRMLVFRPPGVVDFEGNYSAWARKQQEQTQRAAEMASQQEAADKRAAKENPKPGAKSATRKDNPYKRPFGLLSTEQLEKEISKTEKELAACQASFADTEMFRNPSRAQELQDEHEGLTEKLGQLEEEYFGREDL
jgi:ATP-binding cassette subfamily F protein 3